MSSGAQLTREGPSWDLSHGPLRVSDDGHFLVHEDGEPFLWLGDTAWELFHRLDREEAEAYLENRRAKGFTVIQAVCLAEFGGLVEPNRYGHLPLIGSDPARPDVREGPDNDYWDHVDWIVAKAAEKGIYIAMLPTWGDKVSRQWGQGPEIFNETNARSYGQWLGRRYADAPNLIWVNGGDRNEDGKLAIWRAFGEGLRAGDGGRHLITYHCSGGNSSSKWFHDEAWLDFNLMQSGHAAEHTPNYRMVAEDYARRPAKPTIDGEPRYEDHPAGFKVENGWFDDVDVRNTAYWALFAGAFGHTYGCHDIWQFRSEKHPPVTHARTPWRQAMDLPGAGQMLFVRRLLLSRPFLSRVPAPELVVEGQAPDYGHVEAARGADGRYAMVYIPTGQAVTVDLEPLSGRTLRAWWFDPRTGSAERIGEFDRAGRQAFDPPGAPGRGNDWVLVLDDAARDFPPPGRE